MKDWTIPISLIIFAIVVFWFTDFGMQSKVYDCTGDLNSYPKHIKSECQEMLKEYQKQEYIKNKEIYI